MVDMLKKATLVLMLFSSILLITGMINPMDSMRSSVSSHGTGGY